VALPYARYLLNGQTGTSKQRGQIVERQVMVVVLRSVAKPQTAEACLDPRQQRRRVPGAVDDDDSPPRSHHAVAFMSDRCRITGVVKQVHGQHGVKRPVSK
jgi:hypothetical protein